MQLMTTGELIEALKRLDPSLEHGVLLRDLNGCDWAFESDMVFLDGVGRKRPTIIINTKDINVITGR